MIQNSELIINDDGTVFHLHIRPGQLATTILLVGDAARATAIASRFETTTHTAENREFRSYTGLYNGRQISVVSTGIGCDNIDIVITEIDALFNVDFTTREPAANPTELTIVRLGTSGSISAKVPIGSIVASSASIGIDGLAYFYADSAAVRDMAAEDKFITSTAWPENLARPYIVRNDPQLLTLFAEIDNNTENTEVVVGTTISASGFYAPQGRVVRLNLAEPKYIQKLIEASVTNFEMEGAAIALLGRMLGHKTLTMCAIIADRIGGNAKPNYKQIVDKLIDTALQKLTK